MGCIVHETKIEISNMWYRSLDVGAELYWQTRKDILGFLSKPYNKWAKLHIMKLWPINIIVIHIWCRMCLCMCPICGIHKHLLSKFYEKNKYMDKDPFYMGVICRRWHFYPLKSHDVIVIFGFSMKIVFKWALVQLQAWKKIISLLSGQNFTPEWQFPVRSFFLPDFFQQFPIVLDRITWIWEIQVIQQERPVSLNKFDCIFQHQETWQFFSTKLDPILQCLTTTTQTKAIDHMPHMTMNCHVYDLCAFS